MTVYEKLDERGVVVERVQPVVGDYTDTLLGCLVLDGDSHWRIAVEPVDDDQTPASIPTPASKPRAKSHKEQ